MNIKKIINILSNFIFHYYNRIHSYMENIIEAIKKSCIKISNEIKISNSL